MKRTTLRRAAAPVATVAALALTLTACGGNRTRAAELLGIERKTLREKLKQPEPVGV